MGGKARRKPSDRICTQRRGENQSVCKNLTMLWGGGKKKDRKREREDNFCFFEHQISVRFCISIINLFVPSFLEGNSIITEERRFLIIPAELWLTVIHGINEHGD